MVGDKVRAVLALAGKKSVDLAALFGVSKQSFNNKISANRFSADDLIRIADFTGCRLAFVLDDGQCLYFDISDARPDQKAKGPEEDADAP